MRVKGQDESGVGWWKVTSRATFAGGLTTICKAANAEEAMVVHNRQLVLCEFYWAKSEDHMMWVTALPKDWSAQHVAWQG